MHVNYMLCEKLWSCFPKHLCLCALSPTVDGAEVAAQFMLSQRQLLQVLKGTVWLLFFATWRSLWSGCFFKTGSRYIVQNGLGFVPLFWIHILNLYPLFLFLPIMMFLKPGCVVSLDLLTIHWPPNCPYQMMHSALNKFWEMGKSGCHVVNTFCTVQIVRITPLFTWNLCSSMFYIKY